MARHRGGRGLRGGRQANPQGSDGSGRDEAHSSVGQSQPAADQSQTRPPLPEEAAALLRKKVEAIGIHVRRAEPVFPSGPGYGAAGPPCVGRANCFLGRLVDEGLNHYSVTITPEPTPNGAYRVVMTKLPVSANQHTELGGRFPAYDGLDVLFTAGALPINKNEFEVTLSAGGDKRKYKVPINILQFRMLLAGYPIDIPAQALQVLETLLRDVVFNEGDDIERVPIGTNGHTVGVETWKGRGLYQAERYSLEVKYKSLPWIDTGCEQKRISIEVCKIVPRQCYQKNLEVQPEPDQSSHQVVECRVTKCANAFGIEFNDNLTTARVLLPPNPEYHDSGSQKSWFPRNGYCNMKDKGIYGYPIEIQALFSMAMKCALSSLDFRTINDICSYKTEEYSYLALSKFNVIPGSVSYCIFDFVHIHGGYFISNDGRAMDFRWFCLGILIAILSSLATGEQGKALLQIVGEQAKPLLHIVEECWQRLIGEMALKICYPAKENEEWQIITECDPKNNKWSYNNEVSWPDDSCALEALKRSTVYLRGQPIGTGATIHKCQGPELSDAQLGSYCFSPKQLMEAVQKMSVSNKITICLDKSENGSNDSCLKSYQGVIGAARLWCLKYGFQYDFSHIYGATVFAFTTPPGGTFYITVKFEGRSLTLLLAGRDLYIKGWRKESDESFETRKEACSPYMLGNAIVMNIEKNYQFLCPGGQVGETRIGPDALREAFNILYKCRGKRSSEVRRAIGIFAVNFSEAIRIQKVYRTVVKADQQILDPIAPEEAPLVPQDRNSFWIENYGHYSHQSMLDATAHDSGADPAAIDNRDNGSIESATEIFREIRVSLRDACPKGENESKPAKIEDPNDTINRSFISDLKNRAIKKKRKGKIPDFEGGDEKLANAELISQFLLEDWFPEEDESDNDETSEGGDGEADNGKGSGSEAVYGGVEEEIDKQEEEEEEIAKQSSKAID